MSVDYANVPTCNDPKCYFLYGFAELPFSSEFMEELIVTVPFDLVDFLFLLN